MPKLLAGVTLMLLLAVFPACAGDEPTAAPQAATTSPTPSPAATTPAPSESALTWIDLPTPGPVPAGSPLRVAGWAIDQGSAEGTGIQTVEIRAESCQGTLLGSGYGIDRPDVAAHFNAPRFAQAGYDVTVTVPAGTSSVWVCPHASTTGEVRAPVQVPVTIQP